MKRPAALLFSILFAAGAIATSAQVVPSATDRQVTITAGGMASVFQPDFSDGANSWVCVGASCPNSGNFYPVASAGKYPLFGAGAYVDLRMRRWVQFEAEGRWMRFNQYRDIYQDNYLVGPRLPVFRFRNATVYAKALGGFSKMHFDPGGDYGHFTDFAFGGGVDLRLTKRLSIRAADVEYQFWPAWGNSTLSPYGASVGIGYKVY
ncbi:MAG: outer membrane beta-barrel protein [Terracidiphilus sp.]|jgi:hypothetical protein